MFDDLFSLVSAAGSVVGDLVSDVSDGVATAFSGGAEAFTDEHWQAYLAGSDSPDAIVARGENPSAYGWQYNSNFDPEWDAGPWARSSAFNNFITYKNNGWDKLGWTLNDFDHAESQREDDGGFGGSYGRDPIVTRYMDDARRYFPDGGMTGDMLRFASIVAPAVGGMFLGPAMSAAGAGAEAGVGALGVGGDAAGMASLGELGGLGATEAVGSGIVDIGALAAEMPGADMISALAQSPTTTSINEMIANAARNAGSALSAGAPAKAGMIESVLNWMKENPAATRLGGEILKSAFSPSAVDVARERAKADTDAKIQLAQWLRDNNRAGAVGVNLSVNPGPSKPLRWLTGEQVYGPTGVIGQGGLIRPYMKGA